MRYSLLDSSITYVCRRLLLGGTAAGPGEPLETGDAEVTGIGEETMSPLIIAPALSILALEATPATSQNATAEPAKVSAPAVANDPNKVICKAQPVTGSRFETRVCMTRTKWADLERQRARVLDSFERHLGENAGLPTGGNSVPYD